MHLRLRAIFLPVLLLLTAATAKADSLNLLSSSNGNFYYYLTLTQYPTHYSGDFLTVTGFSGITEADLAYQLAQFSFANIAFTSTSVDVSSASLYISSQDYAESIFSIKSNAPTLGFVNYTLTDSAGTFTGQVLGPVASAATPEPSSLLLLGSGALVAVGVIRRRSTSNQNAAP